MPVALIVIEKEAGGRTFRSTWAAAVDNTLGKVDDDTQLEQIIGSLTVGANMDNQTNPSAEEYANSGDQNSLLAAVIGFERLLSYTPTAFKRAYLSDGKTRQEGVPAPGGPFASIGLSGNGLRSTAGENPAPLNIALGINRVPLTLSQRNGLLQLRMAINSADITFGDDDGVIFTNPAAEAAYTTRIDLAMDASEITKYFGPISETPPILPVLVIPKYEAEGAGVLPGQILGGALMAGLNLREPMGRQVKAGRRRS